MTTNCGVIWTCVLFWQLEVFNQIHFLQLPYTVCSLRSHCTQPLANFPTPIWSTGIHGEKRPTGQFRCQRSNSFLRLSYCRPGFREVAKSSWCGFAKRGCWFWWWSINQPKYDSFWCAEGRGRSGTFAYLIDTVFLQVLLPKSRTVTCSVWNYSNILLVPCWKGATILHVAITGADVACVVLEQCFCPGLNSTLASLPQAVFGGDLKKNSFFFFLIWFSFCWLRNGWMFSLQLAKKNKIKFGD